MAYGPEDSDLSLFEISIGPASARDEYRVDVIHSDVGEASVAVRLDVSELSNQRARIQEAVLASAVSRRRAVPLTEQLVRRVGEQLFRALLGTGDVAGRYQSAVAVSADRGERLQIVLRIDSPLLAGLPWEAMYDSAPGVGRYVCRSTPLVRHIPVASVPAPLVIDGPLRILGVVSTPRGLRPLNVDEEKRQLALALAGPTRAGTVDLRWSSGATWLELQDELLLHGPWHALHFIGHGDFDPDRDEGVLALVGSEGRADLVGTDRIVDLLNQAEPTPRLAVLNSCSGAASNSTDLFSGTAAALVRGGISAVAAMQFEISDNAAAAFARGFYTALAAGRAIEQAIGSGRTAIMANGEETLEWLTPVLYLRGNETRLFRIQTSTAQVGPSHVLPTSTIRSGAVSHSGASVENVAQQPDPSVAPGGRAMGNGDARSDSEDLPPDGPFKPGRMKELVTLSMRTPYRYRPEKAALAVSARELDDTERLIGCELIDFGFSQLRPAWLSGAELIVQMTVTVTADHVYFVPNTPAKDNYQKVVTIVGDDYKHLVRPTGALLVPIDTIRRPVEASGNFIVIHLPIGDLQLPSVLYKVFVAGAARRVDLLVRIAQSGRSEDGA